MGSQNKSQFFSKKTLDTQDAFFKNPPQIFQKLWNWLKTIWQKLHSQSFPTDTLNVVLTNLRKIFHRKFKNLQIDPQKNYILFRNRLFSSKHSYGHVDAVLLKLAERLWQNPQIFSSESRKKDEKLFFDKFFYSKCSFGQVECIFDSSAVKTQSNNRSFLLKIGEY